MKKIIKRLKFCFCILFSKEVIIYGQDEKNDYFFHIDSHVGHAKWVVNHLQNQIESTVEAYSSVELAQFIANGYQNPD